MIDQNTPEWEAFRKDKIGASDAPIIMGISPYKTPFKLWQEKVGIVQPDPETFPQKEGKRKEPLARAVLERELGMPLVPSVRLHKSIPWLMASLDAMDMEGHAIAEIKCPGKHDHDLALSGQIPDKYFPQLQHQMEVCDLEMAYYFSFDGEKGIVLKVFRDDKYIKHLLQEEEIFFSHMQNLEPPPLTDKDYQMQDGPQWKKLASRFIHVSSELQNLQREEKAIREQLISMCDGQSSMGGGVKVSKCIRKGNVDYSQIPELKGLNLESFRKKTTEYWKVC